MVNKPLIRPAISGGGYVARGGWLTSHNYSNLPPKWVIFWSKKLQHGFLLKVKFFDKTWINSPVFVEEAFLLGEVVWFGQVVFLIEASFGGIIVFWQIFRGIMMSWQVVLFFQA